MGDGVLHIVLYKMGKIGYAYDDRYSAIRCTSAVPMSAVEVQRVQEMAQAPPPPAPETNRSALNGHAPQVSKPATKQPKGIMGMFSKSAPKTQECSKEVKTEVEEDTAEV